MSNEQAKGIARCAFCRLWFKTSSLRYQRHVGYSQEDQGCTLLSEDPIQSENSGDEEDERNMIANWQIIDAIYLCNENRVN